MTSAHHIILQTTTKVTGIHEHTRTVSGKKDAAGNAVLSHVSLGWFIHTDLDDGGIAFRSGPERPTNVEVGDTLLLAFFKKVGAP